MKCLGLIICVFGCVLYFTYYPARTAEKKEIMETKTYLNVKIS